MKGQDPRSYGEWRGRMTGDEEVGDVESVGVCGISGCSCLVGFRTVLKVMSINEGCASSSASSSN